MSKTLKKYFFFKVFLLLAKRIIIYNFSNESEFD